MVVVNWKCICYDICKKDELWLIVGGDWWGRYIFIL